MARSPRPLFAGATYHVTANAVDGNKLFYDDRDRARYLALISNVIAERAWSCLAYCLMDTHIHLVLTTPEADLHKGVQRAHGDFARLYNHRRSRTGAVFAQRYFSRLLETEPHLLEVLRYVALNPVRAGQCVDPAQWRWSSHSAVIGEAPPAPMLDLPRVHEIIEASTGATATRGYLALVAGARRIPPGTRRVLAEQLACLDLRPPSAHPSGGADLQRMLRHDQSNAALHRANDQLGYSMRAIAAHLGCGVATVARRIAAHRAQLEAAERV